MSTLYLKTPEEDHSTVVLRERSIESSYHVFTKALELTDMEQVKLYIKIYIILNIKHLYYM
jgi:hypothetical protein